MTPTSDDAVPAKATLFCPECGYRDRIDGGWRAVESAGTRRLRCPACAAVILRHRRPGTDWPWSLGRACVESVDLWTGFWRRATLPE